MSRGGWIGMLILLCGGLGCFRVDIIGDICSCGSYLQFVGVVPRLVTLGFNSVLHPTN